MKPQLTISSLDADRLEALIGAMRADIVAPEDMPPDVVTMHSTVRFEMAGTGEVRSLTLAYPKDMAQLSDGISILSPIGSALLGLSVGATIDWPHPDGQLLQVRLLEVLYQPERAGEYFR
ncbi:nucleoside diphosphate kinase regulator [Massilia sp. BJB1822]|uniref:nucleoside diphosphate kinase regulator n=1 Tax=Massilia sp. BJB1822 TaxID=2744470 RepID=UPI001592CC6C|nr:nucleoside diphosphate kinase regulator [Massilia sp. BJB1822]NVE01461.1 nucleoside diphosphate kinase regulator [Massilia sp. BJB1822]